MPWITPTIDQLRTLNKSNVQSQLLSGPMNPNSVLRVMSDANAGLAFFTLLYINWLAKQIMPDTAESEFLDRLGNIWLTTPRKPATYATAIITFTSVGGITMPAGTLLDGATFVVSGDTVQFQTSAAVIIGVSPTSVTINAVQPGSTGLVPGSQLTLDVGIAGINGTGTITTVTDGIDQETDDELRARLLARIQQPPVGGDAEDYIEWVTATPGVIITRAWTSPNEMGAGTVTVRIMCDNVTTVPPTNGFPTATQLSTVLTYLDTVRPVTVRDRWVLAPIPEPINFSISNLSPDTVANRNAIVAAVTEMLYKRAAPASAVNGITQSATTIYAAWVSEVISEIPTIDSFTLGMTDHPMPYPGALAVLGSIAYG